MNEILALIREPARSALQIWSGNITGNASHWLARRDRYGGLERAFTEHRRIGSVNMAIVDLARRITNSQDTFG
jgi:hypothetical protein